MKKLIILSLMIFPFSNTFAQNLEIKNQNSINLDPYSTKVWAWVTASQNYNCDVLFFYSENGLDYNSTTVATVSATTTDSIGWIINQLTPGKTYNCYFFATENPHGGSDTTKTFWSFTTLKILDDGPIMDTIAALGLINYRVQVAMNDENMPAPLIYYKHGLNTILDTIRMLKISGTTNLYEGFINTNLTSKGIAYCIDMEYGPTPNRWPTNGTWRNIFTELSSDAIINIRNTPGLCEYPNGLINDRWYSYSLPYNIAATSISLEDLFGEPVKYADDKYPLNWSVYQYNGMETFNENTPIQTVLSSNNAYFIKHWLNGTYKPDSIFVNNTGTSKQTTDLNWNITFNQGWNLIPWPFLFGITFDTLTGASTKIGRFHSLGESADWTENLQFNPYGAYAVYCHQSIGIKLWDVIHVTNILSKKNTKNKQNNNDWLISFGAITGKRQDYDNGIGVLSGAGDGVDFNDQRKPFNMGDNINLYFPVTQSMKSVPMSYDYRSNNTNGHTWDMSVDHTTKNETITLNWEFENLPAGYKAVLVDINNNEFIELNTTDDYTFRASKSNPFKVIAGSSEYVSQKQNQIEKELPDKFTLYANYPNPFNPGTTIKYDLRLASNVKLSVYNTLGQLVRTLVNGAAQTTGTYTVEWDGKDQLGRMASTGVYIYRLDVKDLNGKTFTKSHKMLLIK